MNRSRFLRQALAAVGVLAAGPRAVAALTKAAPKPAALAENEWLGTSWYMDLESPILELGIVRDSVLNVTNEYQVFGEAFERVLLVGAESFWATTSEE